MVENVSKLLIMVNYVIWMSNVPFDWDLRRNVLIVNVLASKERIMLSMRMLVSMIQVSFLSFFSLLFQNFYFLKSNLIKSLIEIGDYCRLTSNCVVNGTTCKQGQCRCPYNYHSNWDKSICLRNISLGELCYSDEECIIEHSRCYGTCKCRSSHIPNSSGIQCLSVATALYQPCQESSQCSVPYSICSTNGTCICQPDHHDKKFVRIIDESYTDQHYVNVQLFFNLFQACYVTVRLNEICEIDENCAIGNSHCDETRHRCVCDEGFHEVQGKFCSNAKTVQINLVVIILVFNVLRLL